jgi:hypothetical protein
LQAKIKTLLLKLPHAKECEDEDLSPKSLYDDEDFGALTESNGKAKLQMPRSVGIKDESFLERKAPILAHDTNDAPIADEQVQDRESSSSSTPFGYSNNLREGMPKMTYFEFEC